MSKTISYNMEYVDGYSVFSIPELNGREIVCEPDYALFDEDYLEIQYFCYNLAFRPCDAECFTTFEVQKIGGNDEMARATSYYEMLTRGEADGIVRYVLETALGLTDFELTTDSVDFIEANSLPCDEEEFENELEFTVTICLGHGDGGDVIVTVGVTDEEYELLKQCCADDLEISDCDDLSELYERVKQAAQDESEACDSDLNCEIDYESATFVVQMPDEICELVEDEDGE